MRELLLLIKINISDLLNSKFKHRIYLLLLGICIMMLMSIYTMALIKSLPSNLYYIVPYIMGFGPLFLIFFLTITLAFGYVIGFKDYDFLLSLPLNKTNIYLSKILGLVMINILYYLCFMLPSMICYGIVAKMNFIFYLSLLLGIIFQPLAIISIALFISLLFVKISGNSRYRKLISNILNVVFIIVVFIMSFSFSSMSESSQLTNIFYSLYEKIKTIFPSLYWFISGCIINDFLKLLLSIIFNVAIFIIIVLFSRNLVFELNQNYAIEYHNSNYKIKGLKTNSQFITLFKREWKNFILNFNYVLNLGVGSLLGILIMIYIIFKSYDELSMLIGMMPKNIIDLLFLLGTLIIVGINMIDCTSCVSISLEGNNIWILKSLPIKIIDVFKAKVLVNFIVVFIGTILPMLLLWFILPVNLIYAILALLYILVVSIFVGLFGLVINLNFPKLEWDRDVIVIKQSLSSFLAIIALLMIALILGFMGYFISNQLSIMSTWIILIIFMGLVDILLYLLLKKWGITKFIAL